MVKMSRFHGRPCSSLLLVFPVMLGALATDLAVAQLPSYDRVRVLEQPRGIADAELLDHDGRPFKLSQLQGRVALVLFGFTNCPDVCPLAMESMQQLRESGRVNPDEVAFVLISVDGVRDTPPVMKDYLSRFSPDFIGLTDAPNVVKPIARAFSASFFKGGEGHDGHYTVSHSPQVFVIDRDGRLRAEFYTPSLEAMAGTTNALLQESP